MKAKNHVRIVAVSALALLCCGRNLLAQSGALDPSFDAGVVDGSVHVAVLVEDYLLIAGRFTNVNGVARSRVARLDLRGRVDARFDPGEGPNGDVLTLAVQEDGNLVIGGEFTNCCGLPAGRIARLLPDGSPDKDFDPGSGANGRVRAVAVLRDGKILVGGDFTEFNGQPRNRMVRLLPDGALDTGFNIGTGFDGAVNGFAVRREDVLVVGAFHTYRNTSCRRIACVLDDGQLSPGFDPGTGANDTIRAVYLIQDGGVYLGGDFSEFHNTACPGVARLLGNGQLLTFA